MWSNVWIFWNDDSQPEVDQLSPGNWGEG